jgi:hypothetical protein
MTQMHSHRWVEYYEIVDRIEKNKDELLTFDEYNLYSSVTDGPRFLFLWREYHETRKTYPKMTLEQWNQDLELHKQLEESLTFPKE